MFEERSAWHDHELEHHRRIWSCHICQGLSFEAAGVLRTHLENEHAMSADDERLETILSACSRPAQQIAARDCTLCDWEPRLRHRNAEIPETADTTVTVVHFMKHLAGHLDQLALFALPRACPGEADTNAAGANNEDESSSHQKVSLSMRYDLLSADGSFLFHSPRSQVCQN